MSLSFDQVTGGIMDASVADVSIRTDIFDHWLAMAAEFAEAADRARIDAAAAPLDDDEAFNAGLEREFRASIGAVTAAAFAVEAFYWSVRHHAPGAFVDAKRAHGRVFETLKRAFYIRGRNQTALHKPLRLLFRLRNQAVHPPARWEKPVTHPAFNIEMNPHLVWYRVENAIQAHLLAWRLIWFCLNRPRENHRELVGWCEAWKPHVPEPPPAPDWVRERR